MDYKAPELASKRPLSYDVVEGKLFTFTIELHKSGIQIQQLLTFLKSAGKLSSLEDNWIQSDVLTVHSTDVADFSWSPERSIVS